MKQNILAVLSSIIVGACAVNASDNYRVKPKTVVPAQHTWDFSDKEVGKITGDIDILKIGGSMDET